MPRNRKDEPTQTGIVRIGVTEFNTDDMTVPQIIEQLEKVDQAYSETLWNRCYAIASLYSRQDWTVGLNHRATFDDFVEFIRRTNDKKYYTYNQLREMVLVYNRYSRVPDADKAVSMIKEMASISLACRAIPWVKAHPDKAVKILKLCQDVKNKENLTAELVRDPELRLPGQGKPKPYTGDIEIDNGRITKASAVLSYLLSNPGRVVADQMFVLRQTPWNMRAQEFAWYSVVAAYRDYYDNEVGMDEIFSDMFNAWVDAMDEDERVTILGAAEKDWNGQCDSRGIEKGTWPFE